VFQRNINSYPIRRSFSSSNEFKPTFVILDFRDEVTVLQELVEFFDVSASMAEVEQYFISILTEYLCSTQPTTAWNQIWELLEDQADTLVYTGQVDATLHHLPGHSVLPNVPTATDINRIGTGIVRLEINPEYVTRLHRNRLGGR
jgi:hypothetical protein